MSRITMKDLESVIRNLNDASKRHYRLDRAYGGWKVVVDEGPGIRDLTLGFCSKSEVYYQVLAILEYLSHEAHLERVKA